jgi:hypothetical protein
MMGEEISDRFDRPKLGKLTTIAILAFAAIPIICEIALTAMHWDTAKYHIRIPFTHYSSSQHVQPQTSEYLRDTTGASNRYHAPGLLSD